MRKYVIALVLLVGVQGVFAALWFFGALPEPDAPRPPVAQVGIEVEIDAPAPTLRYVHFDGTSGALDDHAGRPVVVHFWGTWCPPCVDELPRILEWAESDDIVVLAVAINDQRSNLQKFFDGEVPEAVVLPPGGRAPGFDVQRLPATVFVDSSGTMRRQWTGAREWTESERLSFIETVGTSAASPRLRED